MPRDYGREEFRSVLGHVWAEPYLSVGPFHRDSAAHAGVRGSRVCECLPTGDFSPGLFCSPVLVAVAQESRNTPKSMAGMLQACAAQFSCCSLSAQELVFVCFVLKRLRIGKEADSERESGTAGVSLKFKLCSPLM